MATPIRWFLEILYLLITWTLINHVDTHLALNCELLFQKGLQVINDADFKYF